MDFPDVSLVIQVGLPADADAYTHRVGRTARAGKDGRAVIMLTQAESYFLYVNRQFPIQPYPASDKVLNDSSAVEKISDALQKVDPKTKQKAYSAYIGFMKPMINRMRMDAAGLVKLANRFALEGMLCDEVPEMEKRTVGKMGMKGVPGFRFAKPNQLGQPAIKRGYPITDSPTPNDAQSRRLRHQAAPEDVSVHGNGVGFQEQSWGNNQRTGGHTANRGGSSGMRSARDPNKKNSGMRGGRQNGRGGA